MCKLCINLKIFAKYQRQIYGVGILKDEGTKIFVIKMFPPFACVWERQRVCTHKKRFRWIFKWKEMLESANRQEKHQDDRVVASKNKYCGFINSIYCIKIEFSFIQHQRTNTVSSISPSFISLVEKITYQTPLVLVCINSQF